MFAHAFSREIELPSTEAARYQKQARAAVGLTSADLRRFATESAWLRTNDGTSPLQHAEDVIDLDERIALMGKIAAAYVALHERAPEWMLWAAFAAIAVNDGVRPAAELAMAAARLARSADLGDTVSRIAEDGVKCAFETNLKIYCDLAWVHHAFLEGGIEVIRWMREDRAIAAEVAEGFEDIERGQLLGGEEGWHLIAHGNLALFEYEQRVVVTPIFEKYAAALQAASDLGLVAIPNQTLAAACGNPTWDASHPR